MNDQDLYASPKGEQVVESVSGNTHANGGELLCVCIESSLEEVSEVKCHC